MPASLVRLLLLMAGIESNPGPISYFCPVCTKKLRPNATSVKCTKCLEWVHVRKSNNCSQITIKQYSSTYICPHCLNDPFPTVPVPITPPSNSTASPPPTPPPDQTHQPAPLLPDHNYDLKLLQWNCNGIGNKILELSNFVHTNNIKILVLQETKLTSKSQVPNIPNFTLVRKDRDRDTGGGLAIFIHDSIYFEPVQELLTDNITENLSVKVGNITISNIYIPPVSSCPTGYSPSITPLLQTTESLVLGDFNAHDTLWHSNINDIRGSKFAEEINHSNLGVLNEENPTRLPTNGQPTSPDISLASISLLPHIKQWEAKKNLGSDHLPIIITLASTLTPAKSIKRTYVNFKKADWEEFTSITEEKFSGLPIPTNIFKAEKKFRSIIAKAAKLSIPAGRIKDIIPEIPTSAMEKINQRDELRSNQPDSQEIADLNNEIDSEIKDHRKSKWRDTVENIGRNCSSKLFKLINKLNDKETANANQAIRFKGKYLSFGDDIANGFNKQFSSVVHHKSSKHTRKIIKNIKKNDLDNSTSFTPEQTKAAIKASKTSKAIGPDGMSNLHLKHLGEAGIRYLTNIYNISVSESKIPDIWKNSIIIPLLKPGKDKGESNSYRPVSLLCPAIKILERLLLPVLNENLEIPDFQHGFRRQHSTVTALNEFNIQVSNGFGKNTPPDRTVLLQLDLSKAFDMVSLDKLIQDLDQTSLPSAIKRWFSCYLRGRQSKVHFRNSESGKRNVRTGVPQGAVTSPILFNFYLRGLPTPPEGIFVVQYADDISIYATGNNIPDLVKKINDYANHVIDFLEERELMVSAEKSTVTLFTPDTKQYNLCPQVQLRGKPVPLEHKPKLLGVIFDTMHTFTPHVESIVNKAKSKVNLMKAVAGSTWGQDKETLVLTYKALGRSILEYAVPIWSPIIPKSSWDKIQVVQNQALRVATGCLAMTPIEHLHRETKVLPVREHGEMLTKQFLLNCHLPGHPGNRVIDIPFPDRKQRKPTVLNYRDNIQHLLPVNDRVSLKSMTKRIHTETVQYTIASYPDNKVLHGTPPEVQEDEHTLSRTSRCLLSQLRSGYSRIINSYLSRIDENIEDTCPKCGQSPHNTNHLFSCRDNPTTLAPRSLWTTPHQAANFLKLDEGVT